MINNQLVYSKELDFIPKLQLSKSRRAVYYTKKDLLKGKLPKKYLLEPNKSLVLKREYKWDDYFRLCTLDLEPIVKNSRSVGTPRYFIINGQDLYSGKFEREARGNLIYKLHDYFKQFLLDCPVLDSNFRHRLVLTWYISKDLVCPDYDNLWIVEKVINDVLVKDLKVLKDDKHTYMKGGSKDYEYRKTEGFKIEIYKVLDNGK